MRGTYRVSLATGLIAFAVGHADVRAADALSTQEAALHIGETRTVCGLVASAKYSARSHRQPTFLDLDRAYPNELFIIVIWGQDRPKFGTPEASLHGKRVCVTGTIESYKGRPEIIARDPKQLVAQ